MDTAQAILHNVNIRLIDKEFLGTSIDLGPNLYELWNILVIFH